MADIEGQVDDGFEVVADAFRANFDERGELGAAFSLYVDGRCRVDLWGGVADAASGRPWTADTLQLVFSTTKGITATAMAMAVRAGTLAYSDRVADHWPEFAAAGKGDLTIGDVLSHRGGLIAVDTRLDFDSIMQVTPIVEALAEQAPLWTLGEGHGYHALTYGWLAGEILARADGRRIGRFVQDEIAGPLGLDMWIGLPESEEERVSTLEVASPPHDPAALELMMKIMAPGSNGYRALSLDGQIRTMPENHFNTRALHATEMPAANGITDARSLARMYAATIGEVDGVRLLDHDTMQAARTERSSGPDLCLVVPTRFGAGYWLHSEAQPMIQDGSFGHPGAGGSLGYANPELGIAYGYVMNQMGAALAGDPRNVALSDAVLVACA